MGRGPGHVLALGLTLMALSVLLSVALPAAAQTRLTVQTPILTIAFERFFAESEYGQAAQRMLEREAAELNAENRAIEAELGAEEQALTTQREDLSAEEFRPLADAFDAKVQAIRAERLEKARALELRQSEIRRAFEVVAAPVLEAMMEEAGAVVVLEQSTLLISRRSVDITDEAISRVNAAGLMPEGAAE